MAGNPDPRASRDGGSLVYHERTRTAQYRRERRFQVEGGTASCTALQVGAPRREPPDRSERGSHLFVGEHFRFPPF
jgi:hypothetical protein